MAGLQTILPQLYEAASVDGANSMHKYSNVTLSLMKPAIFLMSILIIFISIQVSEQNSLIFAYSISLYAVFYISYYLCLYVTTTAYSKVRR